MDLSIIIPCYNEADNVPKLRDEFFPVIAEIAKTRSVEVIFVDDGSTDGTLTALTVAFGGGKIPQASVRFERHLSNRGLGAALRTGFAAAQGEFIVTTDSDGTYPYSEIPGLLAHFTPEVAMVTASPYHPFGSVVSDVPGYRRLLSQGASILYRLLVDWRLHTYTALFRAYRRTVIERISFASDGFLAGTELMVKGMLSGYRVAEHPTVLRRRAFGLSKAKLMRTIRSHLQFQWDIVRYRLHLLPREGLRQAAGDSEWTHPKLSSVGEQK
jgi:dolichol-phosphate mannosyltransferase